MHLLLLLWGGVGAAVLWNVKRRVLGAKWGALFFALWTILCGVPVVWIEGRWMYWRSIEPRIGEELSAVAARLGVAEEFGSDAVAIYYSAPRWWVVPVFGQVVIWPDRDGRVGSWTVSWR